MPRVSLVRPSQRESVSLFWSWWMLNCNIRADSFAQIIPSTLQMQIPALTFKVSSGGVAIISISRQNNYIYNFTQGNITEKTQRNWGEYFAGKYFMKAEPRSRHQLTPLAISGKLQFLSLLTGWAQLWCGGAGVVSCVGFTTGIISGIWQYR